MTNVSNGIDWDSWIGGLVSFNRGNKAMQQKLMRGRVIAQGVTVAAMMGGMYLQVRRWYLCGFTAASTNSTARALLGTHWSGRSPSGNQRGKGLTSRRGLSVLNRLN